MTSESPQSLSASIALGLSASRYAPIAPVTRRAPRTPPPVGSPYRRALVVSGTSRRSSSIGNELVRALADRDVRTSVHRAGKGRASVSARLAVSPADLDLVVVVGRAQRLAEVFAALPFHDTAVAYLPFGVGGSGRWLTRAHALPRDVDGLIEVIFARETIAIPMARVGDDLALVRAGFGLEGLRARSRQGSEAPPSSFAPFSLELDGQRLAGTYTSVTALPDLDALRVELWPASSHAPILSSGLPPGLQVPLARLRLMAGHPAEVRRARSIRVLGGDTPLPGHADGRGTPALSAATPPGRSNAATRSQRLPATATITHVDGAYRLLHPKR